MNVKGVTQAFIDSLCGTFLISFIFAPSHLSVGLQCIALQIRQAEPNSRHPFVERIWL